jgi:hypothetical protein
MSVDNITAMINKKSFFKEAYEKILQHKKVYPLASTTPMSFPYLLTGELLKAIESGSIGPTKAREAAANYLNRIHTGEQARVNDYVMNLTDEDVQQKMVKPGLLTKAISKAFGLHLMGSQPCRLNLELLPILCSNTWKKQKSEDAPPLAEPLTTDMQVDPIPATPQPIKPTHHEPTPQANPNPTPEGSPTQKTCGAQEPISPIKLPVRE